MKNKPAPGFQLRPYQQEAVDALRSNPRFAKTVMLPYPYGRGYIAAPSAVIDTTPVRTIAGLWEARKLPMYYNVQYALQNWQ